MMLGIFPSLPLALSAATTFLLLAVILLLLLLLVLLLLGVNEEQVFGIVRAGRRVLSV